MSFLTPDPSAADEYPPKRWGWLVALGVVLAIGGLWLAFSPFDAAGTLAMIVGVFLLVQAIDMVTSAKWMPSPILGYLVGAIYVVIALTAILWPGITLWAVAVVVGIGFIVAGLVEIFARRAVPPGTGRRMLVVSGILTVISGVLALAWPGATILVLGILLGIKVFMAGLGLVTTGLDLRKLA